MENILETRNADQPQVEQASLATEQPTIPIEEVPVENATGVEQAITEQSTTEPSSKNDSTRFEYWQWMKDDPLTKHPQTGQPVRRIISGGISIASKSSCCARATGSCCG